MSSRRKQEAPPSLVHVVARVARSTKAAIQVVLERHGVHAGQNFILEQLWERDSQTPGELADAIGIEGPTVVRTLQRMEAAGLLVRKKHPTDGRQTAIHLTATGAQLRTRIPRELLQVEDDALKGLSKAERAQLFALLERVDANLRLDNR